MAAVEDYLRAVENRAREPIEPPGFEPNWHDRPLGHKLYPGVPVVPLSGQQDAPGRQPEPALGFGDAAFGNGDVPEGGPLRPDALFGMLRYSHGLLERRLQLRPTPVSAESARYTSAVWSRGAASGGGLYPCEVYWVTGAGGAMLPGVYHYCGARHALHRLLTGDVTDRVRGALPDTGRVSDADGFLLITVKFFKNTFKYANFGYNVVTMDVGCLLEAWRLWTRAHGAAFSPSLAYDEEELNTLLGLATRDESAMAVLPVRVSHAGATAPPELPVAPERGMLADQPAGVTATERERARTVVRFDTVERVHRATLTDAQSLPAPGALAAAACAEPAEDGTDGVALPEVAHNRLHMPLPELLRRRRSAFGTFAAAPPVPATDVGTLLACVTRATGVPVDAGASGTPRRSPLLRLSVLAQHVSGVATGAYDYSPTGHALHAAAPARGVQDLYTLENYNLDQVAAVIAVVARPHSVAESLGPRGFRFLNAEVGMAAQSCYLAAAALGLGCGAALAFDPVGLAARFGMGQGEVPVLLLLIGNERPGRADVVSRLV